MKWTTGILVLIIGLFWYLGEDRGIGAVDSQAIRGQYLVERVALCIECHSPRDSRGNLIRSQLLQGAPIPVQSPYENVQWAPRAPHIAGLPGWTAEDAIRLLTTGRKPTGELLRPPMPPFRMSIEDASAVVAYLKTLE